MGSSLRLISVFAAAVTLVSCSTTRVLQDGEYRLQKNTVEVTNDRKFNARGIEPYIKQKPNSTFFGWNPFLSLYNWSNGKDKGWDKFVQKIGVAPVVYDPDLVESSIENIGNHLEYLGYYHSGVRSEIEVKKRRVKVKYLVTLGDRIPISRIEYVIPEGEIRDEFTKKEPYIDTKPKDEPPVKYNMNAEVSDCVLGSGTIVNGRIEHSIVFRRVFIGDRAVIKNSILMEGCYIGDDCVIENAILDKNVAVSAGRQVIGTEDEPFVVKKDQVI